MCDVVTKELENQKQEESRVRCIVRLVVICSEGNSVKNKVLDVTVRSDLVVQV